MCSVTQHQGQREATSGRLRWGSQALWLGFCVWIADALTTVAALLCLAQVSVQLQLILLIPAVVLTESLCSSWLKEVWAMTGFLSSLGRSPPWVPSCQINSWLIKTLSLFASLFCSTCPTLAISIREYSRCICTLNREYFVELELFKLLKLQGERPRESLTYLFLRYHPSIFCSTKDFNFDKVQFVHVFFCCS